jgi:hypothetical protein
VQRLLEEIPRSPTVRASAERSRFGKQRDPVGPTTAWINLRQRPAPADSAQSSWRPQLSRPVAAHSERRSWAAFTGARFGAITSRLILFPAIVKSHVRSAVPPGKLPLRRPVTR